jgi:CheY-like chemotaxis protein
MANLPDMLRVVVIAAATGPQAQAILELERLLIDHGKVQIVHFETSEPFLEFMQDLTSLPPHFALIETSLEQAGLACLEQLRRLETGQSLPAVMLAKDWTARMLERASQHHAASCILVPNDPVARLEVFTALVRYWCSINEPAN